MCVHACAERGKIRVAGGAGGLMHKLGMWMYEGEMWMCVCGGGGDVCMCVCDVCRGRSAKKQGGRCLGCKGSAGGSRKNVLWREKKKVKRLLKRV